MTDTILLTIPAGARFRGVATLVLGGIGTRLDLPYERIDDFQLALSSALEATDGEHAVSIEVRARSEVVSLAVGPLAAGAGADDGLLRVLQPLVDAFRSTVRDGAEWLELDLRRPAQREAGGTG